MSVFYKGVLLFALGCVRTGVALTVYFDDLSIETVNPTYFDVQKTVAFIVDDSSDENSITSNLTIVKQIPIETDGRLSLLGLSMGEYTLPTGIDVSMGLCEMLDEPIILGAFLAVLGISRDACPPPPGTYFQKGYHLPMSTLPEDFPENKYLATFQLIFKKKPILSVDIYVDIQM